MLLPSLPLSNVDLPAWPEEGAMSMLLVVNVVAFISFAIRPPKDTIAIHCVLLPFTLVLTSISPLICTYLSQKSQKRLYLVIKRYLPCPLISLSEKLPL